MPSEEKRRKAEIPCDRTFAAMMAFRYTEVETGFDSGQASLHLDYQKSWELDS